MRTVLLQAMKEDPPPDARCRDKFLVQTIAIAEGSDSANAATIVSSYPSPCILQLSLFQWQNIEKVSKGTIQERKIRVIFLPADRAATTPTHSNTNGTVNAPLIIAPGPLILMNFSSTLQKMRHRRMVHLHLLLAHPSIMLLLP